MHRTDDEIKQFWNEFTHEYYTIQQESFATITTDVAEYLYQSGVFPAQDIVDLAGGYGKYIPAFLPYTQQYHLVDIAPNMIQLAKELYQEPKLTFIEASQLDFLTYSVANQYDCVFSALNPALETKAELDRLLAIAERYVCLLTITKDCDTLFETIETKLGEASQFPTPFFQQLPEWLKAEGWAWHQKTFTYTKEEQYEKTFIQEYFLDERQVNPSLTPYIETLFGDRLQQASTHTIEFTLWVIMK